MSYRDDDFYRRFAEMESTVQDLAINQAKLSTLIETAVETLREEKNNSVRISVLETNWRWAKWVIASLVLPVVWIVAREVISFVG